MQIVTVLTLVAVMKNKDPVGFNKILQTSKAEEAPLPR